MKDIITFDDFEKIEVRVGEIVEATAPEWSQKLLQFTVDFGQEIGKRTILSGVKQWYQPEDFLGKKFPFIINLQERKMGEAVSQGMMLMVDADEKPIAIELPTQVVPGSVLR